MHAASVSGDALQSNNDFATEFTEMLIAYSAVYFQSFCTAYL